MRAGAAAVALVVAACGAAPSAAPPVPASPRSAPSPAPERYDPAEGTAVLRGVVRGTLPAAARGIADVGGPDVPGNVAPHAGREAGETNPDGSLPHAFVWAVEGPSLGLVGYPLTPVEVVQTDFAFEPHVAGVCLGAEVRFRNADPSVHNVHAVPRGADPWNHTQPPGAAAAWRPGRAEFGVRVVCDLHSWMRLWVHVLDHPFSATSARGDGAYEIRGLRPGRHRFRVWHEAFPEGGVAAEFEADLVPGVQVRDVRLGD